MAWLLNAPASRGASGLTLRMRMDLFGSPGLRNAKTSVMSVRGSPFGDPTLAVSSPTLTAIGPGESKWSAMVQPPFWLLLDGSASGAFYQPYVGMTPPG